MNIYYIGAIIGVLVILILLILILRKRRLGHLERSLEMSLFLIRLPRYKVDEKGEEGDVKK